jgi:hypothetical protein
MRILSAARHPPGGHPAIGGVQTWCATVGAELERRGHTVAYWGPKQRVCGFFDLGILANIADTRPALLLCRAHVAVCHGIIEPERPPARDVVFTSEEVRDFWQGTGPVIRQPIDLAFWRPLQRPQSAPTLVRFSYRDGLPVAEDAARSLGLEYLHVRDARPKVARELIHQAACVLATGRAAVEAMACGVPVVICDDRNYQGPLLDPDTLGAMQRNYSGRGGVVPTVPLLTGAIELAIAAGSRRAHVETHHDVRDVVDQLLCCTC